MRVLNRLVILVLLAGFLVSAPPPLAAATTDTFRDEFNDQLYSNNDGTALWAGDWTESESPQDPFAGTTSVQSDGAEVFALLFADAAVGDYVERTADLSAFDAATLTFHYRQHFMTPAVGFEVQVSEDGSSWDTVWSMWGSGSDVSYVPVSVDLSGYSATSTIVRFIHTAGTPAGFIFHIDNVQIAEATPANQPPATVDDNGSTTLNTPVTIDVLANDSDADLDPLLVDSVTQGAHGLVANNGTDVTYTPNLGWRGVDTFTYTATDGNGGSDTASVTVGVGGVCYVVGDTGGADALAQVNLGSGLETLVGATGTSGITAAALHPLTGTLYASLPGQLGTVDVMTGTFMPTAGSVGGGFDNIQAIAFDTDGSLLAFHQRTGPKDLLIRVDPTTGAFVPDAFGPGVDSVPLDSFWPTQKSVVGIDINVFGQMYGATSNDGPDYTIQWIDKNSGSAFVVWGASATVDVSLDATGRFWMLSPTGTLSEPFGTSIGLSGLTGYQAVACEGGLVNQSPSATGDADITAEDTAVTVDVLANDSDADLDPLVVDAVTDGLNGSVTNNGTDVTYTPDPDWNGIDTFSYTVSDGNGGFASAQVTVTVTAQPDPPVAVDDSDSTVEDVAVTVDVLANDSDVDLDVLSVSAVTQGSGGLVVNNLTNVIYTPTPGWAGIDTFTYTVSDGNGGTDIATVTVTVSPVNDDPVAVDDPDPAIDPVYYMVRKASSRSLDVLVNDFDPEGTPLSVISAGPGINGGTATVAGDGLSVTYAPPDPSFVGPDTFSYTISDGNGGTGAGSVDVVVVDKLADLAAESMATDPAIPSQGSPFDLVVVSMNLGPDSATNAEVTFQLTPALGFVSGSADNGTCSEMPPGSGTVVCTHGNPPGDGVPRVATVTVISSAPGPHTVMAVLDSDDIDPEPSNNFVQLTFGTANSAPDAVDDAAGTPEDIAVVVNVLANDSDVDLDGLSVSAVTQGSGGSVVNNGTDVTYTPNADWNGVDTFMYVISDGNGGSASAVVSVTVAPANDDPLGVLDLVSTPEDSVAVIDVLANDTDVDSFLLAITAVTNGSHGTVSTDGFTVTYAPEPDWFGTDMFTYRVSDDLGGWGETTVTVTVTPVNDNPVAVDDISTTPRDTPVYVWVLDNDTDVDPDTLSVSAFTNGTNGLVVNNSIKVTYTPAPGWTGTDSFTYTVSDGNGGFDTATVMVTVTAGPNRPPVAQDDGTTIDEDTSATIAVLANDLDPDGDNVTVSATSQGAHGTVTKTAKSLTYTPDKDWAGIDSFSYSITDGLGGTATAAIVITVKPVNDAPIARDDAATTTAGSAIAVAVLANDTDVEGQPLTVVSAGPGSNGVTATDGVSVTYVPAPGWFGTDLFSYTISDGHGGIASATVKVTVDAVTKPPVVAKPPGATGTVGEANHAPAITVTGMTVVAEGTSLRLVVRTEDPDGDDVTISVTGLPGWAELVDDGRGGATINGIPGFGAAASSRLTISASDGKATTAVTVTIEVLGGNRPPRIGTIRFGGVEDDGSFSFTITASDPDGDPLAIAADGLPGWASLTDNGGGSATIGSNGVPVDALGWLSVVISVTDGRATVTTDLVRPIADLRPNRPPESTHQAFGMEGAGSLVATAMMPRVGSPDLPTAHLTPREGLMVAFGSAVETIKNQILPALVLGVVMAWMLMIGVGRTKEEEDPAPA